MITVTTNYGASKSAIPSYGDGSINCPFCNYPIESSAFIEDQATCLNPWCEAHPTMNQVEFQRRKTIEDQKRAADEERRRQHEFATQQHKERQERESAWRLEQIKMAREGGYCLSCLFPRHEQAKFIKHRGKCPKSK